MKFVKWYWNEYKPLNLLTEFVAIVLLSVIITSPLVIYAGLAALEYHFFDTRILAVIAAVLFYGAALALLLSVPFGVLREIKQRYDRHKRWENGKQK